MRRAYWIAALALTTGSGTGMAGAPTTVPSYTQSPPLGRSVHGRPIRVVVRGNPASAHRMLVVGCIHGNECAGIAVTRRLRSLAPRPDTAIWIVDDLNPDGHIAGTRPNARAVNLNRNFPWKWHTIAKPGDPDYSGTRVLSEPEARFAAALIQQVQPQVTVWYHQDLNLVDLSGGSPLLERRYACLTGMRVQQLQRYDGSVSTWQNHTFRGTTAFVVELPPGTLSPRQAARHAAALTRLARPARAQGCPSAAPANRAS